MPVGDCMEATSSTDFIKWCVFLDKEENKRHTKDQWQLALIAFEIHKFQCGFSNKKPMALEKFLIEFKDPEPQAPAVEGESEEVSQIRYKPRPIDPTNVHEIGMPMDENWQKVNDDAKARWGALLAPFAEGQPAQGA